ncbi:hypothetical protein ACPWSR_13095 [Alloiococcus sp. CFN-8]|uniref:hypothetical protein n=1 Tax=Alloiococcus sp. CFN-8 TaxID=3416081 RepID=UPI003CEA0407
MDKKTVLSLWKKVAGIITDEITTNDEFSNRMGLVFEDYLAKMNSVNYETVNTKSKRGNRRNPAKVNPFDLLEQGVEVLKAGLDPLDIEELKDIIAENGMDTAKLAMKWKNRSRLINHIIDTTQRRYLRGEAFWNAGVEKSSDNE